MVITVEQTTETLGLEATRRDSESKVVVSQHPIDMDVQGSPMFGRGGCSGMTGMEGGHHKHRGLVVLGLNYAETPTAFGGKRREYGFQPRFPASVGFYP